MAPLAERVRISTRILCHAPGGFDRDRVRSEVYKHRSRPTSSPLSAHPSPLKLLVPVLRLLLSTRLTHPLHASVVIPARSYSPPTALKIDCPGLVPKLSPMTAMALHKYSPDLFNSLPSVDMADCRFQAAGGLGGIYAQLAALATKHAASAHFGLHLLHRHSDLESDEVMIAFGRTSLPVKRGDIDPAQAGNVYPVSWGIEPSLGTMVPLEFAFAEAGHERGRELDLDFANDVAALIKSYGLQTLLGIALLDGAAELEVESTHDRANITCPLSMAGTAAKSSIEVVWGLALEDGVATDTPGGVRRACMKVCTWTKRGHVTHTHGGTRK
ncbi:hypothetical protein V8E36_009447 [Tilletia maclaganii]